VPTSPIGLFAMVLLLLAKFKWWLIAAAAIGLLWAGFTAGGWRCAAQQVAVIEGIKSELARQATEFAEQQAIDARAAQDLSVNLAASRRSMAALQRELDNVDLGTGDCDRPFSNDFRRLWNDAIHPAGNGPPEAG